MSKRNVLNSESNHLFSLAKNDGERCQYLHWFYFLLCHFFIFATECGLFPGLDVRDVDECGLVSVFFLATAGFNLYAIEKPLGL